MKSIIMNATDINALLAGQKSQHRVPINPQPTIDWKNKRRIVFKDNWFKDAETFKSLIRGDVYCHSKGKNPAPYGIGDTVYVKETWTYLDFDSITYKASYKDDKWAPKWRSPLVMPEEWASRIKLKIVSVKVERVQDVSKQAIFDEGVTENFISSIDPRKEYITYWDNRYAKKGYPYSDNPWCWVYGIERSEG